MIKILLLLLIPIGCWGQLYSGYAIPKGADSVHWTLSVVDGEIVIDSFWTTSKIDTIHPDSSYYVWGVDCLDVILPNPESLKIKIDTVSVDTVGWNRVCVGMFVYYDGSCYDSTWIPILEYTTDTTYYLTSSQIRLLEKMGVDCDLDWILMKQEK